MLAQVKFCSTRIRCWQAIQQPRSIGCAQRSRKVLRNFPSLLKRQWPLQLRLANQHAAAGEIDARRLRVLLKDDRRHTRAISSRAVLTRKCPGLPAEFDHRLRRLPDFVRAPLLKYP